VDACMKEGLDSLKWSMNAADERQFEKIMGVSGRLFHNALDNVRSAWEVRRTGGYGTGLYASSIQYDGEQQVKMERLLNERVRPYVDQHYWLPLYSMGSFATQREHELGYRPTAGNQLPFVRQAAGGAPEKGRARHRLRELHRLLSAGARRRIQ
ncbi:MAG: hypothetical protein HYS46_00920, partial [Betaproteobacteria bacterium]|nr:hypothetical protein [Betaproteobacteria bacterium]